MRSPDSPGMDAPVARLQDRAEFSHSALENLFEFSPDAIFVADSTGEIRAANVRAEELFGYSINEFVGMKVESLVPERFRGRHPSHRENYNAHPRARQMGAAINLFALRKDGSEFPVDIMLKPMQTPEGMVTLSFVRDATEQRGAVEVARRHDLQLRSIVDSVRDYAIYLLDTDGNVLTWNPGAERIKGYTDEEVVGQHFSRFFVQEDLDRGRPAELLRLAAQKMRVQEEGWRVRKDGSRFWADITLSAIRDTTGELIGFAKVTRDFTDRKRAEEAVMLQLSNALLANMDVSKLLGAISASIGEVIPHDAATLGLYDSASDGLIVQFLGTDDAKTRRSDVRLKLEGSPAGEAFRTREPVYLNDLEDSRFALETMSHLVSLGMRSALWVPLVYRGAAIGTLCVASRLEATFGQRESEVLVQLAD